MTRTTETLNRRQALRTLGWASVAALAAACAQPAATPTSAPAAKPTSAPAEKPTEAPAAKPAAPAAAATPAGAAADAEWDKLLAAARQEGKLAAVTGVGSSYRRVIDTFQETFPGISVEHTALRGSDFATRVQKEREAGLYTFDVAQVPTTTALVVLRPAGAWDPVRSVIFRPDVLDDKVWSGGFDAGWPDSGKNLAYAFAANKSRSVWINTTMVKPDEIRTFSDLADPKWKGKIVMGDPRSEGRGYWPMTAIRINVGPAADDLIKRFLTEQDVLRSTDARQMTEFMVRGRYAIGIGAVDEQIIRDFVAQGVGKELEPVERDEWTYVSGTNIWLVNRAPNPNTAKLFINWLLTKDGQDLWAREIEANSRRLDVPPGDPPTLPEPGKKYVQIDHEELIPKIDETRKMINEILK